MFRGCSMQGYRCTASWLAGCLRPPLAPHSPSSFKPAALVFRPIKAKAEAEAALSGNFTTSLFVDVVITSQAAILAPRFETFEPDQHLFCLSPGWSTDCGNLSWPESIRRLLHLSRRRTALQ